MTSGFQSNLKCASRAAAPILMLMLILMPRGLPRARAEVLGDVMLSGHYWDSSKEASLDQFQGQIVILDFFAHWCLPCRKVTSELEKEIQQFYTAKGGNATGHPVRVLSVNVEQSSPARTTAYIRQTGPSLVVTDTDGRMQQAYEVNALPAVVVLDGTAEKWRLVRRFTGRPDPDELKRLVDSLGVVKARQASTPPTSATDSTPALNPKPVPGAPADSPAVKPVRPPAKESVPVPEISSQQAPALAKRSDDSTRVLIDAKPLSARSFALTPRWELSLEGQAMVSTDVAVYDGSLRFFHAWGLEEIQGAVSMNQKTLSYQPAKVDFLGVPRGVNDSQPAGRIQWDHHYNERLSSHVGAGAYTGFSDYRSLWLNEYYRQQYHFLKGYRQADPEGYSVVGGGRWEYLHGTGVIEADVSFLRDTVAPGYEKPILKPLIRGLDSLRTVSGRISFENVLGPRVRVRQDVSATDTTDRALRIGYQASLNWALNENWVAKWMGSFTREAPQFVAWSAQGAIERDWHGKWFVGLEGRYYEDNGLVDPTLRLSSAAPGLTTVGGGVSMRWQGLGHGFKLFLGPYISDYEAVDPVLSAYTELYRDRTWFQAQIAWSLQF